MPDLENLSQKVIEFSFYALLFLVPLILTPWNYELFEFNKMLMVYFLTTIIVAAWLIKIVATKKFIFRRSFWDIPLLIFLLSQVLSYLFSIDRHTSFWGYYSRFNGGLLSIICYAFLYCAFVSNLTKKNLLFTIYYLLFAATLVAAYGIAEHFGIDAQYWVQDVRNRVFSTLGQPNWLATWLAGLIPISWALALNLELGTNNLELKKVISYLLSVICYLCLLFTRSRSGLLGFAVAFFVFWFLAFLILRKKALKSFLLVTCCVLLVTFLAGSWIPGVDKIYQFLRPQPTTESTTAQPLLISESGDIRRVVWKGAVDIWRHYPIFGTGPETFAYSYYWYRPREHNDLSEWDFLYNKAHNEYLNYAATTGTVGLGSYLLLIGSFVFWSLKKLKTQNSTHSTSSGLILSKVEASKLKTTTKNLKLKRFEHSKGIPLGLLDLDLTFDILHLSLLSGFSSIVVSNFFGFSVVPVNLLFYLFPAMSVVLNTKRQHPTPHTPRAIRHLQLAIIILILLVTGYGLRVTGYYWLADTHFARGEKLNKTGQYDLAFNSLRQAVELRSAEPVYHDELGLAAANLAVFADPQKNATLAAQLMEIALAESNKAVKTSPYHLNFWKNRTKIFYKLAEIKPEYYQQALASLLRAAELAPTEPKIKYNLGLIYAALDQTDMAIKTLEETIQLKPNYEDPRLALALFYEQKGEKEKAREQLEYILNHINPLSEGAKEKLKEL